MVTGSNLDVDNVAEQLFPDFTTGIGNGVITLFCPPDNGGVIYFGTSSGVTAGTTAATDGFPIWPGQAEEFSLDIPSKLYGIGSANNLKIFFRHR
jgi:hypothetical protein